MEGILSSRKSDFSIYILSLIGAVATVIVFAFLNFQTRGDAEKDQKYQDTKMSLIQQSVGEIKSDIKDLNHDLNAKMDKILDKKK